MTETQTLLSCGVQIQVQTAAASSQAVNGVWKTPRD